MKAFILRLGLGIVGLEAYYFLIPPTISLCALVFLFMATGCTTVATTICPPLSPPPGTVVDALETAGRKDPSAASWVIDLALHYQKLDACQK